MQRSLAPRSAERLTLTGHMAAGQTAASQTAVAYAAAAPSILIIGNDSAAIAGIRDCALRLGHRVQDTRDVISALGLLDADRSVGVVFVDGGSPWFDGLALMERLHRTHRGLACILFARNPEADDVVRALRLEAADVVTDPEDEAQVERALARVLNGGQGIASPVPNGSPASKDGHGDALEQAYLHGLALVETVRALRGVAEAARVMPFVAANRMAAGGMAAVPVASPAAIAAPPQSGCEAVAEGGASDSLGILTAIRRKRAAREKFFPKGLFEDPCWDMLLDLMINHLQGRRISVSSLCIASGVAQTTALRRITDLHDRGLVRRIADDKDGRRVFIELTEEGVAAMERYVETVGPLG
ncbi:response regulator (plasmid) [Azospirillum argentinense]|uniref:Response regulator n=1 Tax=Azospirillum argentinense TaxID=2970906 RepID=A0A4D8PJB0_9PROT|nr:response regulator [Azospirillum argentinense]QCN96557.1 response regulator [Azospirillum argentinense]